MKTPTKHSINGTPGRTGVLSLRRVDHHVCRCLGYEFEDCINSIDDVTLHSPDVEVAQPTFFDKVSRRLMQLTGGNYELVRKPQIKPIRDYFAHELFFVFCQNTNDIHHLSSIPNWRRQSEKTACWVDEMWLVNIQTYPKQLELLKDFDFIFVTFLQTADYLQSKGFNAFYIPAGIDCIRFCPIPKAIDRTIDVLAMGRKAPNTHRKLFELTMRDDINYVYDTSSLPNVKDHIDHRALMAKQIARSRFFFVQRAKADVPHETGGQVELGSRYFEGCAAGAVLVGEQLDVPGFNDQFGWEDSVISMPYDSADISPIMEILRSEPDRMSQIHHRNARQSLLKHDWAYRWESMLKIMGIEPKSELADRKRQLSQLAFSIEQEEQHSPPHSSVA